MGRRMGLRGVVSRRLGLLLAGAALALGMMAATAPAEARSRHRHYARHHHVRAHWRVGRIVHIRKHRVTRAASGPKAAEIVIDANSGRVLHEMNANEPRHPASLTKVMTLYLLFEQLESGRISLSSEIPISAHAAAQAPSKLGLRPGSEIEVEDAIKAIVTKSANDIAVAVAEKVGGTESGFAEMMTRKAHALGMTHTHYANASGLPNPEQITTARDLAILGRAIQDRFPKYYRYFSTRTFNFAGQSMRNHNHLLGRVEGMDGIKTGYTVASGFNLLTSVRREGRHIVSVVLGGVTARARDQRMAALIEDKIDDGATRRTAVALAGQDDDEKPVQKAEPTPVRETVRVAAMEPMRLSPPARIEEPAPRPQPARAERSEGAALQLSVPPAPIPTERVKLSDERPRPAYVAGAVRTTEQPVDRPVEKIRLRAARTPIVTDGSTSRSALALATTTPSTLRWVTGAQPTRKPAETAKDTAKAGGHTQVAKAQPKKDESDDEPTATIRSGWIIQIGATDDIAKAKELLSRAKDRSRAVARAHAFTEKVQKGKDTLYRARFAGLQEASAESACRELKRSGFACFTMKN